MIGGGLLSDTDEMGHRTGPMTDIGSA